MPVRVARGGRLGRARPDGAVLAGPCLAALLAACLTLAPQPVGAQSLNDASAAALESSFALRADQARQDGAEARLRGAVDAFMPTVAIIADKPLRSRIDYFPQIEPVRVGIDSTPRKDPTQLGITADLPLFDGLRRWHTLQSARTLAESGRFITLSRRQQVLLDTAAAYIAVLRDTRIVGYRESQVAAIARIRDATEKQFELQDATRTDVALTRSRVQEAEAARDRALADLAASRREFTRLTRMEPERMVPPRFPDNLPRDEDSYADLVRDSNPGIASAHLDAKSAAYLAEAQAADFLPTVNLQFSKVSQLGYSPALDKITDTTTRILARVPLYEPGAFPRLSEASAFARQRGYEAQDSELATLTQARIAFARRKAISDQLAKLTARVGQLRETMKGYEIERGAGFRTILDELNIRAELADAEVSAAIVLTERDGQSLQLAAAANLLDVGTSVPAAKRFEAILPAPTAPRLALRRGLGEEGKSSVKANDAEPVLRSGIGAGERRVSQPAPRLALRRLSGKDDPFGAAEAPASALRGSREAMVAPVQRRRLPTLRISRAEADAPL